MVNPEWSDWKESLSVSCDITVVFSTMLKKMTTIRPTVQCIVWHTWSSLSPGNSHLQYGIKQRVSHVFQHRINLFLYFAFVVCICSCHVLVCTFMSHVTMILIFQIYIHTRNVE